MYPVYIFFWLNYLTYPFGEFQMWTFLIFAITMAASSKAASEIREVEIQTRLGSIIGLRLSSYMNRGTVFQFLDIPYGKAPVGHFRFQKPQSYGAWSETLNATALGPVCMQSPNQPYTYPGFTEDCLKLNIYVPNNVSPNSNKSVMVWIHGGGFSFGSGGFYDASMLSIVGDVIIVTINYRLGIFGFLATRNNKVKGNAGLWDQIMALDWVRYNIKDYGGNPRDVTIFGESAGGMSVLIQSLIPSNRGLFHRIIAQSGTANSFLTFSNATLASIEVAKSVGCLYNPDSSDDFDFIGCLHAVDANDLVKATDLVNLRMGLDVIVKIPFGPIVDGELIRRHPLTVLNDRTSSEFNFFQSLDMLAGTCTGEGSLVVGFLPILNKVLSFNLSEGVLPQEMKDFLIPFFTQALFRDNANIANMICSKYCVQSNVEDQGRQLLNMWSDAAFQAPARLSLDCHSSSIQSSATYQYVFFDELSYAEPKGTPWYKGSAHATDVFYIFFYEQLKSSNNFTEGANILVEQMRSYWTNFAKTGYVLCKVLYFTLLGKHSVT